MKYYFQLQFLFPPWILHPASISSVYKSKPIKLNVFLSSARSVPFRYQFIFCLIKNGRANEWCIRDDKLFARIMYYLFVIDSCPCCQELMESIWHSNDLLGIKYSELFDLESSVLMCALFPKGILSFCVLTEYTFELRGEGIECPGISRALRWIPFRL